MLGLSVRTSDLIEPQSCKRSRHPSRILNLKKWPVQTIKQNRISGPPLGMLCTGIRTEPQIIIFEELNFETKLHNFFFKEPNPGTEKLKLFFRRTKSLRPKIQSLNNMTEICLPAPFYDKMV